MRWTLGIGIVVAVLAYAAWLVWTDAPAYRFTFRLFHDNHYMKDKLVEWGAAAPVIFIVIQALQVVIAPIPGEVIEWYRRFAEGRPGVIVVEATGIRDVKRIEEERLGAVGHGLVLAVEGGADVRAVLLLDFPCRDSSTEDQKCHYIM